MLDQPYLGSMHSSFAGSDKGIIANLKFLEQGRNRSMNSAYNSTTAYVKKSARLDKSVNLSMSSNKNNTSFSSSKNRDNNKTDSSRVYLKKNTVSQQNILPPNKLMNSAEFSSNNNSLSNNIRNVKIPQNKSMNKSMSTEKDLKTAYNSHNKIPKTGKQNSTKGSYDSKNGKKKGKKKPISDYERLVDMFSDLIQIATSNAVYFLEKDVLNSLSGIYAETFQMEKMMKINQFCKDVENIETEVAKIQNFLQIKKQNNMKTNNGIIDGEEEEESEDENFSVNKIASERRLSVYDYFFDSFKENINDVVFITLEMKEIKKQEENK